MGILGFLLNSCNTAYKTVENNQSKKIYNLKYGEHERNVADVFLPNTSSTKKPMIVLVHGGGWKVGNKRHFRKFQNYFLEKEFPVSTINYRFVDKNTTYKDELEDIKNVIKTLNENAEKFKISTNNFVLIGESAGAHLSLLYAYQNPEIVKKVVSISGPTDFYSENYRNSFYHTYSKGIFQKVVGEKYKNSKDLQAFKEASPIYKVSNVPTLLFHGNWDHLVSLRQAKDLDSVLTEKNIPHRFIFIKNGIHASNHLKKSRENIILPEILKFIKE